MRFVLCLLTLLTLLCGCGGAGEESATNPLPSRSAATFTIVWPQPSRLIPVASRAVRIDILQRGTKIASKTAARGSSSEPTVLKIENIPADSLVFEATALPNVSTSGGETSGSGVPQAHGTASLHTQAGKTTPVAITMGSTIVRLEVTPNPLTIAIDAAVVPPRATAYDAQNRVVLTDPTRQFEWTSADPSVASITLATGVIGGHKVGTTTISVKDKESEKTATGTVIVQNKITVDRVTLSPATGSLQIGKTLSLTAKAFNTQNQDLQYGADKFTWSSSDTSKATVSATGMVTAVASGSASIQATEKTTGKFATATVTVEANSPGEVYLQLFDGRVVRVTSTTEFQVTSIPTHSVVSRTGGKVFRVTRTDPDASDPDGEQTLWVQNVDGSGKRALMTHPSRVLTDYIYFSPNGDGSKVLTLRRSFDGNSDLQQELTLVDVATGGKTSVPAPFSLDDANTLATLQGYSPKGDRYRMWRKVPNPSGTGTIHQHYIIGIDGTIRWETSSNSGQPHILAFNADGSRAYSNAGNSNNPSTGIHDGNFSLLYTLPLVPLGFHPQRNSILYRTASDSNGNSQIRERNLDDSTDKLFFDLKSEASARLPQRQDVGS